MSSLQSPARGWWGPFPKEEKLWLILAILGAVIMSVITVGWVYLAGQNVPAVSNKVTPEEFEKQVMAFQDKYKLQDGSVRVPPGEDAYLLARMWSWSPVLRLKVGQTYNIWLSSKDVLHGFSFVDQNYNVMAAPGHAYRLRLTPQKAGEYLILCNEYCGAGHGLMASKIIVEE